MQTFIDDNGTEFHIWPKPPHKTADDWWIHVRQLYVGENVVLRSYFNSDRDALTCPYHLLNVPGPNAEWGIEVEFIDEDV